MSKNRKQRRKKRWPQGSSLPQGQRPPVQEEPEFKAREAWEMEYGPLPAEDIIENQKLQLSKFAEELEQLQRENRKLKEELRIARSDRQDAETAIANYFINHWRAQA